MAICTPSAPPVTKTDILKATSRVVDRINNALQPGDELKWIDYVAGYLVEPFVLSTIASGDVYQYEYNSGIIYYRFIANDLSEDTFYDTFDGMNLSGVIATKQLQLA